MAKGTWTDLMELVMPATFDRRIVATMCEKDGEVCFVLNVTFTYEHRSITAAVIHLTGEETKALMTALAPFVPKTTNGHVLKLVTD
jgi:hypothetical protein